MNQKKSMTPLPQKNIGLWGAVAMGIGAMVGAGIFALLGEASVIAGNAVFLSFILGGIVALFSGYSLAKLGVRYPSSGGIVEYLLQAFGPGIFTGTLSLILYLTALVSMSLISKAFGNYATVFFGLSKNGMAPNILSIAVIVVFVLLNLKGVRNVAFWEKVMVGIKFLVLVALSVSGLWFVNPELLSPSAYPPISNLLASLAITFFAYEGFRVVTNAVEDMPNPSKTLPRAILISIFLVMGLYVLIALSVFGTLSQETIIASKDFALAKSAVPIFGEWGFKIVSFTALIATASAINANLYSTTNISYHLAKNGELPFAFGKPFLHSREGLIISGIFVILLSLLFNLSQIAVIGSIFILFIHAMTHLGHLKIIKTTNASKISVAIAFLLSIGAMVLALAYTLKQSYSLLFILFGFFVFSFITEILLQKFFKKKPVKRIQ